MQIRIKDRRNASFPVTIAGMNTTALYDKGVNMSCMSYACYRNLNDLQPFQNIHALSVCFVTGYDMCPMDLVQCNVILGHTQFVHTFIVCKNSKKELVLGLHMEQLS